jgi:hypothetical protein
VDVCFLLHAVCPELFKQDESLMLRKSWPLSMCDVSEKCCACLQDFLRNNRGINDGADLAEDYLSDLYLRIVNNEIKMKASSWAEPVFHGMMWLLP